jgi:hypothetical protein
LCFKERKGKVDKYEIVSENIKEERMIQKLKKVNRTFYKAVQKLEK